MNPRAVILAAGESKRMGTQKLLMPFRGKVMIEYALEAARDWNPIVIAGPEVAAYLRRHPHVAVRVNDRPRLGMSHSLDLAEGVLHAGEAMLVLLADKPLVTGALIRAVCEKSAGADVGYPVRRDEPGHPVFFSSKARKRIAALPAGDTLRLIRDDPSLVRITMETDDPGAFFDIDEPGSLTKGPE